MNVKASPDAVCINFVQRLETEAAAAAAKAAEPEPAEEATEEVTAATATASAQDDALSQPAIGRGGARVSLPITFQLLLQSRPFLLQSSSVWFEDLLGSVHACIIKQCKIP